MRRALSFLVVAILLLLVSVALTIGLGAKTEEERVGCSGSFAVIGALAYVIWPEPMTKVLFGIVTVPIWILGVALSILGFCGAVAVCGVELFLPLAVGLLLVERVENSAGPLVSTLVTILYLSLWIALRKQQWRLIAETWQTAGRMYEAYTQPIFDLAERINVKAEKIGKWVRE